MSMVVTSKVKEAIKQQDMHCSGDFCEALDKRVQELVTAAAARAKSNDRKTVRSGDL